MSILSRLFGSGRRPTTPPTCRGLLRARTPPWHRVAPIVIDAIFEGLDNTDLFDSFVSASMEKNLVPSYEKLGLERENADVIRANISLILCQIGNLETLALIKALEGRQNEAAKKIGFLISNLYEPAIALTDGQIGGYLGMARMFAILGLDGKCKEYAKRGLMELETLDRSFFERSAIFTPDVFDAAEKELRELLEGTSNG